VVGTNLVRLVSTHQQSNLARFLVSQQLDFASSPFLPFARRLIKSEQLGAHFKEHVFVFFKRLDFVQLLELNDGFKVNFGTFDNFSRVFSIFFLLLYRIRITIWVHMERWGNEFFLLVDGLRVASTTERSDGKTRKKTKMTTCEFCSFERERTFSS